MLTNILMTQNLERKNKNPDRMNTIINTREQIKNISILLVQIIQMLQIKYWNVWTLKIRIDY